MVSASAVIFNKLRRIRSCFAFFCFAGIALSSYAFYVETKKEHDDSYVAMCDISESMSCTKVFSSKYTKLFLSFVYSIFDCYIIFFSIFTDMAKGLDCFNMSLMKIHLSSNPILFMVLLFTVLFYY